MFGIARTTAVPCGRCDARLASVRPAAIDSSTVDGPIADASVGSTSSMICGFTASTITAGADGNLASWRTRMPWLAISAATSVAGVGSWT